MSSSTTKKSSSSHKVVDNLKTQLEELLESLDRLYVTINEQLGARIGSDFDEINALLAEGFRSVLDGKPPNEVVEDAPSSTGSEDEEDGEEDSGEYDSECSEEEEDDEAASSEARQKSAEEMMKMIKALTGASAH
ncbi:hypothetical protein TYRP_009329 [Tyrophagus putrescentiae]|nr:hypothetical protein TYRP_009329 [Tyrophagus putrescentiae]